MPRDVNRLDDWLEEKINGSALERLMGVSVIMLIWLIAFSFLPLLAFLLAVLK